MRQSIWVNFCPWPAPLDAHLINTFMMLAAIANSNNNNVTILVMDTRT